MPGTEAPRSRPSATRPAGRRVTLTLAIIAAAALGAATCRSRQPASGLPVASLQLVPASPVVDQEADADVMLRDSHRRPLAGGHVRIEAQMQHPGMAPVIVPASERAPGEYGARLRFPMAGDWVVFVAGTLADGDRVRVEAGRCSVEAAHP